jgi:hypothetical protein
VQRGGWSSSIAVWQRGFPARQGGGLHAASIRESMTRARGCGWDTDRCQCDMCVDNDGVFKSQALRHVGMVDLRLPALITLVKCWAKAQGVNDPTNRTLNSFAITLLIVHHLQQCLPAVLPPLAEILCPDPEVSAVQHEKVANRDAKLWHDREWSLNDGQIPNPNGVRVSPGTGSVRGTIVERGIGGRLVTAT